MTERSVGLKVAVVTQDWPHSRDGGVALSEVLAQGLRAREALVEVWTPGARSRAKSKVDSTTETNTRVRALPGSWWRKWGRSQWKKGATLHLAEFAPRLVIATSWRPLAGVLDAVLASPLEDRPAVAAFAGSELSEELSGGLKTERKRMFHAAVRWFTFSERYTRLLARQGVPMERTFQVPAAVAGPESPPDRGSRTRPRRLLTVAPLVPPAGQDKVIESLAHLAVDRPSLKYEIVGDGPDEGRLRELAQTLGIADRVVFRGRLEGAALEHAYSRADIFVLPGRRSKERESEPDFVTLWLEAGARGLPILGSGSGDLQDGVNAKVVGRPSDTSAVTEALDDMIKFPLALTSMGRSARRRFESSGRPAHLAEAVLKIASGWYQA